MYNIRSLMALFQNEKLLKVKILSPPEIYCAARSPGPVGLVWANTFWNIWFGSHNYRRRCILQIYTTWSVSMDCQKGLNQVHGRLRVIHICHWLVTLTQIIENTKYNSTLAITAWASCAGAKSLVWAKYWAMEALHNCQSWVLHPPQRKNYHWQNSA